MVKEPFEEMAVDFIGPLPLDSVGNKFICVCIDEFTRAVTLTAVPAASSLCACTAVIRTIATYEVPARIRTDGGSHFTSSLFEQLVKVLGVKHVQVIPYRHEANGILEHSNRETNRHLVHMVFDRDVLPHWSKVLPLVECVMNSICNLT